jgi:aldehyde dehydrogenase (NAD+)
MGRYHAKYTFDEFSHEKSIYKASGKVVPNLKYPPYNEKKIGLVRRFLK